MQYKKGVRTMKLTIKLIAFILYVISLPFIAFVLGVAWIIDEVREEVR